jgi:hypothetical protein
MSDAENIWDLGNTEVRGRNWEDKIHFDPWFKIFENESWTDLA